MDSSADSSEKSNSDDKKMESDAFKKPVLVGKIGRLPKKIVLKSDAHNSEENTITPLVKIEDSENVIENGNFNVLDISTSY